MEACTIHVRSMRAEDLITVRHIMGLAFDTFIGATNTLGDRCFEARLNYPGSIALVAENNGVIVGGCHVCMLS